MSVRQWLRRKPDPGPPCHRCDKPTGKPWLWWTSEEWWRCDRCQREMVKILADASADGLDISQYLRWLKPYADWRKEQP